MSEIVAKEEEESWVLDSLVGFLRGPVWNLTIQSFIENKSVGKSSSVLFCELKADSVCEVFEDNAPEECVREYDVIFQDYKRLVDRLLSSYSSDLGISSQEFDSALNRGLLSSKLRQMLFEQIFASNDFTIFVRFMTQRNIELQLQAIEVLAQKFGLVFDSFVPFGQNKEDFLNEDKVFKEAIRRSLEEDNDGEGMADRKSLSEQKQRLEAEREIQQQKLSEAIQTAITEEEDREEKEETVGVEEAEVERPEVLIREELKSEGLVREESGLNGDEMRKRSEYLRKQRDKLLAHKKQEREKQMLKIEGQEERALRPKSARVVRAVASGEDVDASEDQSLAFRRSLAARLKKEVIEQQKH
ncbi:unnamed protein product [Medioppia subpectinata]|uniref:Cilia- and flagella-associated protein 36 n=1 Tax=Medioppia subpectinata TaxID=1979941 RepID=A0A7R9KGV9_9ACAR|nr:unnamed protein product [Medioppia subpectinata]CAG2103171.1 unnamed protein product [Medioppia subpectinata]